MSQLVSSDRPSRCNNGGCTRPVYIGKECFNCWAGTKWDSMLQRVSNNNGHYPTYHGLPFQISRRAFIEWAIQNPPPVTMKRPSVDRIEPTKGYVFGNIRWLEFRKNGSGAQRDIPEGFYFCVHCKTVFPKTNEFFRLIKSNGENRVRMSHWCRPCCKIKEAEYRLNRRAQCS